MDLKLRRICSIGTLMAATALVLAPSKAAAPVEDNVEFVELFKLFDRADGNPIPYEFEACVSGAGVTGATIKLLPDGTPEPLGDEGEGEYCYVEKFASATALKLRTNQSASAPGP